METIAPLLNGQLSAEEIVLSSLPLLSRNQVLDAIEFLYQQGHLEESVTSSLNPPHAAFWSELGVSGAIALEQAQRTKVKLIKLGGSDPEGIGESILNSLGMLAESSFNFVFATTSDHGHPDLELINNYCLEKQIPWLLVKSDGVNVWVGPLFAPGAACWQCLKSRLTRNREIEGYVERSSNLSSPIFSSVARSSFLEHQALGMGVTQLLKYVATGTSPLLSRILISETLNLNFSFHAVVKRPQCKACGNPAAFGKSTPIVLSNPSTCASTDGGVRVRSPEETLAAFGHHISPITGVVSGLHSIAPVGPVHVYSAGHNFALKNDSLYFLQDSMRINSSGKGRTAAQAMTSALCEALERYSGLHTGEEVRIRATFRELGDAGIHPNECMLYSDRQYVEREKWIAKNARFQVVPFQFDIDAVLDWSPVFPIAGGQTKYVPTNYLYYGHPEQNGNFVAWADSNGCAAGSTHEDAILQGMLELVERDAVAIWWYNRLKMPRVALETFDDPIIAELTNFYSTIGREFWVLDLTSDLGIPTFASITRRIDNPTEDIVIGFGSHLDPAIGLNRAISEMNQFMPAVLSRNSDGSTAYHFGDAQLLDWWHSATIKNQPYLLPSTDTADTGVTTHERWTGRTIRDQIDECLARLKQVVAEVYVLDQTRPDIGLPVVKIIAPGMRHFWARFAPGRLYDVPVKMGWLKSSKSEDELNPIAMFV